MFCLRPYDEKAHLADLAQGSETAFRAVYDAYFPRLSAFCFKICKSEATTEEIIQEVFVKLWVNRSQLAALENLEGYLFAMARNRAIDHLRLLAKQTRLIQTLTRQQKDTGNVIEERLDSEGLKALIAEALEELSPQKKRVFQLSREEGLSHDEIAEMLQLSKSTIKNHLSETLRHIRKHLGQLTHLFALILLLKK